MFNFHCNLVPSFHSIQWDFCIGFCCNLWKSLSARYGDSREGSDLAICGWKWPCSGANIIPPLQATEVPAEIAGDSAHHHNSITRADKGAEGVVYGVGGSGQEWAKWGEGWRQCCCETGMQMLALQPDPEVMLGYFAWNGHKTPDEG